jgi:GNAT superfamily N-acetyltransferase
MPEDIPLLLDLIRQKSLFDGCPGSVEATPERLSDALFAENPMAGILLAEVENKVVGFASYFQTFSTFLARPGIWLDDLFVLEGVRNRGIGKALLAYLARKVQAMDGGRLEWTAAHSNNRGLAFYHSHGARVQEEVHLLRLNREQIDRLAQSSAV